MCELSWAKFSRPGGTVCGEILGRELLPAD